MIASHSAVRCRTLALDAIARLRSSGGQGGPAFGFADKMEAAQPNGPFSPDERRDTGNLHTGSR